MTNVERISFGLPQYITVDIDFENIKTLRKKNWKNKNVRIRVTLDKGLKKSFDFITLKEELLNETSAEEIKFQFIYHQTSNVRAKEISETNDIVEKFKVYASVNKIKYNETILGKISQIQDNLQLSNFCPHDTFELQELHLRGAIGIKDGIGLSEIHVDFKDFAGVMAVMGKIGSGKTTLLENCHPFPCMLTRQGSLKDHFYLKDSFRTLIYKTQDGSLLKINMIINGTSKSVGTLYTVEKKDSDKENWVPLPGVDGSFDSYKEWVNTTFGSLDLFLRTSFYTKEQVKGIPDLSRATKSEKMSLFAVLAGTDYLGEIAAAAKEKEKDINEKINNVKNQMSNYAVIKKNIDSLREREAEAGLELGKYNSLLEKDMKELEILRVEQEKYNQVAGKLSMLDKSIDDKKSLAENYNDNICKLNQEINHIEDVLRSKDDYQKQWEWYIENTKKQERLKKECEEKQTKAWALGEKFVEMDHQLEEAIQKRNYYADQSRGLLSKITTLEAGLPEIDAVCPTCGAKLSSHKSEELKAMVENEKKEIAKLKKLQSEYAKKQKEFENRMKEVKTEGLSEEINELNKELAESRKDIDMISAYAATLDLEMIKYALNNAEQEFKERVIQKKEFQVKHEKICSELKELQEMKKNQPLDYSEKIKRIERGTIDERTAISDIKAELKNIKMQLETMADYETQVANIETKVREYSLDLQDFELIEKAFGNNGIQSIELDSAAPELSDIANAILLETYGDRFSISFETERDTTDGRRINDFIINVFDADCGREKRIDLLSSGEGMLIKQALYYAFSVLRARRTNFCFKTRFLDESDGSFDPDTRVQYLKMIEAAHNSCGASLTILITHSQEIRDLLTQKINMAEL